MLIEIHILQNHAPGNLNRDDTGSPKECTFGGTRRARISSQCLKRSIRQSEFFRTAFEAGELGTRTRRLPELVRERFLAAEMTPEMAALAARKASGFGTKDGKEQPEKDGKYVTAQTMFLTESDIASVTDALIKAAHEAGTPKTFGEGAKYKAVEIQKSAQQRGFRPIAVDVALFGRMTTSEALRDVEASCQVAHAISTHKVEHEFDYFTAADDLRSTSSDEEEDAGADMLGDVEFNSACYYKYFSVDLGALSDNLSGARLRGTVLSEEDRAHAHALASRAVLSLIEAACRTTPSGKQNSFAAHQLPATVLVEVRPQRAPVSYANAFVDAVRVGQDGPDVRKATGRNPDLVAVSLWKLGEHVKALTEGFGLQTTARFLLAPEFSGFQVDGVQSIKSLSQLGENLQAVMRDGSFNVHSA